MSIQASRMKGMKWHAKVFVAKDSNGSPVLATIGSSNITRRAFDTLKNFNYECDVVFWDETNSEIYSLVESIILSERNESQDDMSVVVTKYNPEYLGNNQRTLEEKIKNLESEILEGNIQAVDF